MSDNTHKTLVRAILSWIDSGGRQSADLHEGDIAGVGREPGNEILIASPHVSRRHAVITWRSGGFVISDLGSLAGTQVNGRLIDAPTPLHGGDILTFFDVEMSFHLVAQRKEPDEIEVGRAAPVLTSAAEDRLVIGSGPQEGREIALPGGRMVIGRANAGAAFDIALPDRSVSRPHAQVERVDDHYVLTDLGSANGTLVNGRLIEEPTLLRNGDVLLIGETTILFRAGK
jgi:pSer/pThr/pTyr-binding forkhead associated (FHA) protein